MAESPYNYDTFKRQMMQEDMHFKGGPQPGQLAPDFDLPAIDGSRVTLGQFRGSRPVLLEFGSIT